MNAESEARFALLRREYEDVKDILEAHVAGEEDAPPYTTFGLRDLIGRMMQVDWINRSAELVALHNEAYPTQAIDLSRFN